MIVLLGIGFLAGLVTAISPCVLPVLPIILATGATSESRRRPLAIILGLATSFVVFTLAGSALLSQLGLPQDFLRDVAIALLFVVAVGLLVPRLGEVVARPLSRLSRRGPARGSGGGSGLLLGVSLGLVFVPCAGPVLTAVTVTAASGGVGVRTVLLSIAYAIGVALPMLAIAYGGQRFTRGVSALRRNALVVRRVSGVVLAGMAVAFLLGVDTDLAKLAPGYTNALQKSIEQSPTAKRELRKLTRGGSSSEASLASVVAVPTPAASRFPRAPELRGINEWINTPGAAPLTLAALRGKVVLVDFWTYSCINCLRTLPHLRAWDAAYRDAGLVIIGVHSPEFAFERVPANVKAAVRKLGVRYPVALDNAFATWKAYDNEYWPAHYLIDKDGRVRDYHAGEGQYAETEALIRRLLAERGTAVPRLTQAVADATPTDLTTPETYLGYARLDRYTGRSIREDVAAAYTLPVTLEASHIAYGGTWRVEPDLITAGPGARLRLAFDARKVYLVLGGAGSVEVWVDGRLARVERVAGYTRLHTLLESSSPRRGLLELRFTPGVEAYAFTFG